VYLYVKEKIHELMREHTALHGLLDISTKPRKDKCPDPAPTTAKTKTVKTINGEQQERQEKMNSCSFFLADA
jgi:hypothetical protein